MRKIRLIVAFAATVLVAGIGAPLAQSQTPLGYMSEEEMMQLNDEAESEWRLPGGGKACAGQCPAGMRCCAHSGIEPV